MSATVAARAAVVRADRFDEIFREHRGRVLALCLRLTGNRALAEDALQETFLDVHRGLAAFRGEAALGTWIYRIALRAAVRLRARRPDLPIDDDPSFDPHATLEARDRVRRLQAALAALPSEQRTVLALFAVDGLTHPAIAEILGIPEGTVWSRLHSARRALRTCTAPLSNDR